MGANLHDFTFIPHMRALRSKTLIVVILSFLNGTFRKTNFCFRQKFIRYKFRTIQYRQKTLIFNGNLETLKCAGRKFQGVAGGIFYSNLFKISRCLSQFFSTQWAIVQKNTLGTDLHSDSNTFMIFSPETKGKSLVIYLLGEDFLLDTLKVESQDVRCGV